MSTASRLLPSISFSGAGFLGCYHLGVASCLIKNGLLMSPSPSTSKQQKQQKPEQIICGSSAGAIVASALTMGVSIEDGMDIVLNIVKDAREKTGILDCLTPGFSLIDAAEPFILQALQTAAKKTNHLPDKCLRIALTHPREFINPRVPTLESYRYLDTFRNVEDIVAASILSSWVPGVTGPANVTDKVNTVVRRSFEHLAGDGGAPLTHGVSETGVDIGDDLRGRAGAVSTTRVYWDGGLCNMWPIVDDQTLIVTPLNGMFSPNPFIAPAGRDGGKGRMMKVTDTAHVGVHRENAQVALRMMISSDDEVIEGIFKDGYDDTRRYLKDNNLLRDEANPF